MNIIRGSIIGLGVVVGGGLLAWPALSAAGDTEEVYKRDEQTAEVQTVDDHDDDDTNDGEATNTRDNTRGDDTRGDDTRDDTRNDR